MGADAALSEWWYRGLRVLSVVVLLGAWQMFGGQTQAGIDFLPPLSDVVGAFVDLLGDGAFWSAAADTVKVLVIGYALTVVAGVIIGVVMGSRRTARRAMRPLVSIALATPIAPLVPILIIIFGIGTTARVATVFILATPILVENTAASVAAIPQRLVQMGRSFGASERQLTAKVVIPAALPGIMAGLRLSAGRAVVGMVVGELIIASAGLGQLIRTYSATFDAAPLYATVVAVLLIGLAAVQLVRLVERRATRWRP
jgi:NitT/TauT family transport system permease protein